jgi:tripeptide aminopeptidase
MNIGGSRDIVSEKTRGGRRTTKRHSSIGDATNGKDMNRARRAVVIALAVLTASAGSGAQSQGTAALELMKDPVVRAALNAARATETQTVDDQVRFCEQAAPPFQEAARAELLRQAFQQGGLAGVRVDSAGNVLGDRPGSTGRPRIVVAAHLDTVFPAGTDVKVRRDGAALRGPGIGDNCRGLAVMTAIARILHQANVPLRGTVTFAATVGEEGLGDLRGVRQLFKDAAPGSIDRFVAIDGSGLGITNVAVGSRRYRVTFRGPGGHSYAAFGLANPIDAMGRAIAKISEFQVARDSKTTFNVGRVGGGTSVNAIPSEAWMEIDLRSPDAAALSAIDDKVQRAVDAAAAEENERWRTPRMISVVREKIGDRPAGSTPSNSAIVRIATGVHQALGLPTLSLTESSTDSNLPMSLHVPAITIGGGGRGAGVHAAGESFDTADSWQGTERAVLLTIALTQ